MPTTGRVLVANSETETRRHAAKVREATSFSSRVREIYLHVTPEDAGTAAPLQARSLYTNLARTLEAHGASLRDVVREKIFYRDVAADFDVLCEARGVSYGSQGVSPAASTHLAQPPCDPRPLFVTQVHAVVAASAADVEIRRIEGLPGPATGCVVATRGIERAYLCNVTGEPGDKFRAQAEAMFDRTAGVLGELGIGFRDVVRTWIYLPDLYRHYDELNDIRTSFFAREGIERLPASTGIQGGTQPPGREALMDVCAVFPSPCVEIEMMHAPAMNEATAYGSSFSRGMLVRTPTSTMAYVSGTASIDSQGRVVHEGDVPGQTHRMLDNVSALLQESGMDWSHVLRATAFLKQASFARDFEDAWSERRLPNDFPIAVCRADVCRPEWLCEIEVTACRPGGRADSTSKP